MSKKLHIKLKKALSRAWTPFFVCLFWLLIMFYPVYVKAQTTLNSYQTGTWDKCGTWYAPKVGIRIYNNDQNTINIAKGDTITIPSSNFYYAKSINFAKSRTAKIVFTDATSKMLFSGTGTDSACSIQTTLTDQTANYPELTCTQYNLPGIEWRRVKDADAKSELLSRPVLFSPRLFNDLPYTSYGSPPAVTGSFDIALGADKFIYPTSMDFTGKWDGDGSQTRCSFTLTDSIFGYKGNTKILIATEQKSKSYDASIFYNVETIVISHTITPLTEIQKTDLSNYYDRLSVSFVYQDYSDNGASLYIPSFLIKSAQFFQTIPY